MSETSLVFKREMESTLSVFVGVTVMDRQTENSDTKNVSLKYVLAHVTWGLEMCLYPRKSFL